MEDMLARFESQLKQLIENHNQLKRSNHELQLGKFTLSREKESLLLQQRKAISQIETLVNRLKSIET
jgi:uncharacterized protein (TIGR02449 family)